MFARLPPTCRFVAPFTGDTSWVDEVRLCVVVAAVVLSAMAVRVLWNWLRARRAGADPHLRPSPWGHLALIGWNYVAARTEVEQLGSPATQRLWTTVVVLGLEAAGAAVSLGFVRRPGEGGVTDGPSGA